MLTGSAPEASDGRFRCVDCGVSSPDTSLDETSVSLTLKHGWRLVRRTVEGRSIVEARCPSCHARAKARPPF